jgi:hypothetical protein
MNDYSGIKLHEEKVPSLIKNYERKMVTQFGPNSDEFTNCLHFNGFFSVDASQNSV